MPAMIPTLLGLGTQSACSRVRVMMLHSTAVLLCACRLRDAPRFALMPGPCRGGVSGAGDEQGMQVRVRPCVRVVVRAPMSNSA